MVTFIETFGRFDVAEVKRRDMKRWLEFLRDEKGLSPKTCNKTKAHFGHFFKWCVDGEYIRESPLKGVWFSESRRNCPPRRPRIIFKEKELVEILEKARAFDKNNLFPFMYALMHLGSRAGETLSLKWDDVDLAAGFVEFREENTKTGVGRMVELSPFLKGLLSSLPRRGDYVFANERGGMMSYSTIHGALKRFREVCPQMRAAGFHSLRHSFAANALMEKKMRPHEVQKIMGHETSAMTMDLYGKYAAKEIKNPSPYGF